STGLVASADADHVVRIWNLATGGVIAAIPSSQWAIERLAFSPSGQLLAIGRHDGSVSVHDASSWIKPRYSVLAGGSVHALAFSPASEALAIGWSRSFTHSPTQGGVFLVEGSTGSRIHSIPLSGGGADALVSTRRGEWLFCGCTDGSLYGWTLP